VKVIIAKKRGFCFGVEHAIELAEKLLAEREHVYCLGPLIHNRQAVERLEAAGLRVVEKLSQIPLHCNSHQTAKGSEIPTVMIRSHGCHPSILEEVKSRGLRLADATCVLVKRLQKLVRQCAQQGYQVAVVGDPNHPEIKAVLGYAGGVTVIANETDIAKLPNTSRLAVLSQTTHSAEDFGRIVGLIAAKGYQEIKVINTICRETARRQVSAIELCRRVDVMFVLGGRHSANTAELADLCRRHGIKAYHLQDWSEFKPQYVEGKSVAGITAGASTPEWIIQQFADHLREIRSAPGALRSDRRPEKPL